MKRHTLVWAAVALAISACGPSPVPSGSPITVSQAPSPVVSPVPSATLVPSASPSPSVSPTTSLGLTTEFREHCGSIGGCAAYVALIPAGETEAIEAELAGPGPDEQGLPALIAPGSYTVRFRLAAVSDDRQVGVPADETTVATCEVPIEVFTQSAVNITVAFDRESCEASATYTVTIID